MKKIGQFFRNYGFYLAIGVICIGSLAAIFIMPNKAGNVKNEANPYAKNKITDANDLSELPNDGVTIVDEDDLDKTDDNAQKDDEITKPSSEAKVEESVAPSKEIAKTDEKVDKKTDAKKEETAQVKTNTFESTTASVATEPFFADGDTFAWPLEGEVVVPYTDESTKYWFSDSLNQTMRTFGICISAKEGTEVKAMAKGKVTDIIDDSSTYLEKGMPYVGKLMVIDHGNGYVSLYGFQDGTINEKLLGQVVNAGDVLGTIGSPKGAFISLGDNIYLQVTHNDKVVNPLNYLDTKNQVAKEDGVDMGFAK